MIQHGNERTKAVDEKFCTDCGQTIKAKAEICPKCGVRQLPPPFSEKSRLATALLALFLGGLGGHRFYLGHVGLGFLYLLFCWTLVPSMVAFIEFIYFLIMSDAAFNQKYGEA